MNQNDGSAILIYRIEARFFSKTRKLSLISTLLTPFKILGSIFSSFRWISVWFSNFQDFQETFCHSKPICTIIKIYPGNTNLLFAVFSFLLQVVPFLIKDVDLSCLFHYRIINMWYLVKSIYWTINYENLNRIKLKSITENICDIVDNSLKLKTRNIRYGKFFRARFRYTTFIEQLTFKNIECEYEQILCPLPINLKSSMLIIVANWKIYSWATPKSFFGFFGGYVLVNPCVARLP